MHQAGHQPREPGAEPPDERSRGGPRAPLAARGAAAAGAPDDAGARGARGGRGDTGCYCGACGGGACGGGSAFASDTCSSCSSGASSGASSDDDGDGAAPPPSRGRGRRRASLASSTLSSGSGPGCRSSLCGSDSGLSQLSSASSGAATMTSDLLERLADPSAFETSEHHTTTPDGWRLFLLRVRAAPPAPAGTAGACGGAGAAPPPARRFPVVLCPGLASGGVESYDLDPSVSMARFLAARGYDVWVPDLRGNGRSDRPNYWDRKTWWTVDEHLLIDFPTVVSAVLLLSGARQLHWVGHSMGGMLAVGAQSRGLECAAALRSITLLASGCFGAGSWHSLVGPFVRRITAAGFHAGQIVPFAAALRGPLAPLAWGVRALFYVRGNVEPRVARKLLGSFLSFIPSGVVAQFMGSLNSDLGISSADGSWNYADPKVLAHVTTPIMAVNGSRDLFCPAAGGLKTVNLFGGPHRRFLFLGPDYGTAKRDYGHFCPLVGKDAVTEVFPHIEAFISEFDHTAGAAPAACRRCGAPPPPAPAPIPAPAAVVPLGDRP